MADRPRRAADEELAAETNVRGFDAADVAAAGPATPTDPPADHRAADDPDATRLITEPGTGQAGAEDPAEQTMLRTSAVAGFDPEDDDADYSGDDDYDEGEDPKERRRRIAGWVIVTVLALVAASGAFLVARNAFGAADQAIKPDRFVEEYLQAIAAGDAEEVLGYGPRPPADSPLLTDELLASSNNRAPLTDIEVVASNDTQVQVEYQRGGQPVTGIFDVSKANGRWTMQTWGVLQVTENDLRMPFLLDGVELPGPGAYPVFPGNYLITSSSEALDIDTRLQVPDNASDRPLGVVPMELTDAGRRDALSLIGNELDRCFAALNEGNLTPDNCPIRVNSEIDGDGEVLPETIDVEIQNDPLHGVEVNVVDDSPIAVADLSIDYTISGQAQRAGETLDILPRTQTAETTATVAFDQDPPTVGWAQR